MSCDATYRLCKLFAKWPESVHDFRVCKESLLARIFESSEYINLKISFFYKQKFERKNKIHTYINIFHPLHFSFHLDARTGLILSDSGYALNRYLMVPYLTQSNKTEENFDYPLCCTRMTIEQAIGILKRRFSCLHICYMYKCIEY